MEMHSSRYQTLSLWSDRTRTYGDLQGGDDGQKESEMSRSFTVTTLQDADSL